MNDETWKDIEGYEGKYQVSDLGRVRSLARVSERGRTIEAKFLSTFVDAHGYLAVNLAKTVVKVHRLVAKAFICNSGNKAEVNHINGIRHDARKVNLEWVSRAENQRHSWNVLGRKSPFTSKVGVQCHSSKGVVAVSTITGCRIRFDTQSLAAKVFGVNQSCVSRLASKKTEVRTIHDWVFENE